MSFKTYYLDLSNDGALYLDLTSSMDNRLEEFQTIAEQFGFYKHHVESNIRWAVGKEVYISSKNKESEIEEDFVKLQNALKSLDWKEEHMDKNYKLL